MKKIVVAVMLLAGVTSTSFSEAILLPTGTILISPENLHTTLDEPYFLLDRLDMEAAVLAMETVPIREEQIKALETSIDSLTVLLITVPILTAIVAYLIGTAVSR